MLGYLCLFKEAGFMYFFLFFSSRRRHTRLQGDWSSDVCSSDLVMDEASRTGHLEVVEYLHSIGKNCTRLAMVWASEEGYLEIVKYLHSIGKDCPADAMDRVSRNGHLEVVRYLHSIGK